MENIKFIDITQLPEDLWQDAKNLIALDSNGDVIKAAKQDSYTKDEIDELLKDAEISADKLQNKIKINSASTDYVVTQPTVSGDSLVITDSMSDKNQYHTFGYDKTITATSNKLLDYSTPLFRGANEYNCPQWDGNTISFAYLAGMKFKTRLTIPYTYNGVKYVTHIDAYISYGSMFWIDFGNMSDTNFPDYQFVPFRESEIYKTYGAYEIFSAKIGSSNINYDSQAGTSFYDYIYPNNEIQLTIANFQLTASNGELEIETPRFYLSENNFMHGDIITEYETSDYPERMSDYIRYSNDVKAYILTDKNTTFKTINGEQITGNGDITIDTNVDLSNYATKSELNTKQDVISDLDSIRSGAAKGSTALQSVPSGYATEQWVNEQGFLKEHQDISNLATKQELATKQDVISDLDSIRSGAEKGATALQSVPDGYATEQWVNEQGFLKEHQDISNLATKAELATKQDVINDLDSIRSGAAKGATALQSVPSGYATEQWVNEQGFLKEHQDISNLATKSELNDKQDKLVSGTNIKSINSASLLGSGNMELATKEELNAKQNILVSGENIKTVNGTSLLGSGNIVIEASAENVPTLQTDKQGTTNNYVYSSGIDDNYGIISGIKTLISYRADKASIHTDWYYWGNTYHSTDGADAWSIEGATTSQAGLMSASDKSKLDGIDLSTKQDTLVSGTNIKTVNGTSLLGSGDITIEGGNVDLSNYYTKPETNALVSPKLSQVTLTQAEYDALQTKENNVLYIISDASTTDSSDYYTKAEIDAMIGGASSTITQINNLVG